MKYIKTYENKNKPKFKRGDYVKIVTYVNDDRGDIQKIWESPPYKIIRIGSHTPIHLPMYFLDTFEGGKIWRPEHGKSGNSINILEYVPDYEVSANKYNL